MSRLLGIDYGLSRVGLAVTDPSQYIASPLVTVPTTAVCNFLQAYLAQEEVEAFVIGIPSTQDNQETWLVGEIHQFTRRLKALFPNKHFFQQDERYTSKLAVASMVEAGFKKKDRRNKANIDKISAAIILQSFLNSYIRTSI